MAISINYIIKIIDDVPFTLTRITHFCDHKP